MHAPFMLLYLWWYMLTAPFQAVRIPGPGGAVAGGGGSFTLIQSVADRAVHANNLICSGSSCTLTVSSTGSGHGAVIQAAEAGGAHISSVSGGGTWTAPVGCQVNSGPVGGLSAAYNTSLSSGITSISITFSGTIADLDVVFREVSWSGSSISYDTCGTVSGGPSTSANGPTLTLSGSSDAIGQFMASSGDSPTSVASPYNTTYIATNSVSAPLVHGAGAIAFTSSGTGPLWSLASNYYLANAIALKGN